MSQVTALMTLIGRLNPAAWDGLIPKHGGPYRFVSNGYRDAVVDQVALNPQPLPPVEIAAGEMAYEVVRVAAYADLVGADGVKAIYSVVDDWCGTGWPRRFPIPLPGPQGAEEIATGQLVGAMILAGTAESLEGGLLKDALLDGAERLAAAATVPF